jgi:hypothetical protein
MPQHQGFRTGGKCLSLWNIYAFPRKCAFWTGGVEVDNLSKRGVQQDKDLMAFLREKHRPEPKSRPGLLPKQLYPPPGGGGITIVANGATLIYA